MLLTDMGPAAKKNEKNNSSMQRVKWDIPKMMQNDFLYSVPYILKIAHKPA